MSSRSFVLAALTFASCLLCPDRARAVDPDSESIGCDRADERITISASAHLDPSCTWTKGVKVAASDVTLDCQGARIASSTQRYGIHIIAATDVALSNVTIRNCHIEGFLNSLHIEREGFRELPEGVEYENSFSDIIVEDSTMRNSHGVGIFVNGYVTDVTLRRLHIEGTGSAGIYLETGSKDNVVEDNQIVNNGYRENGPEGQFFELAGFTFWFWGPGRAGVAIDGSRTNLVRNNYFAGNSAGGIFLYKNCGEYPERDRYFERRYGAHGNVIENNTFAGEDTGVWIGSRMAENTLPMNCTDPEFAPGYRLDHADDNSVRSNVFHDVTYGVRVEDDRAIVENNEFFSTDGAHVAVILGTPIRTSVLGLPVDGTRILGNRAHIEGSKNPYRWVHGHVSTTFAGNQSLGRPVGLCEGVPPARGPFVMTIAFVAADRNEPPTGEPPVLAPPEPLPPCPIACGLGVEVTSPKLEIRRLATPPGDDTLSFRGRLVLPDPFEPTLDPIETGIALVVEDAAGKRLVDLSIPGGAYDPEAREGWKQLRARSGWKYVNRHRSPPGGIRDVVIHDLSRRQPGTLDLRVRTRRGAFAISSGDLPLTALVSLDPPTAETGQCGQARFAAAGRCSRTPKRVICR